MFYTNVLPPNATLTRIRSLRGDLPLRERRDLLPENSLPPDYSKLKYFCNSSSYMSLSLFKNKQKIILST